MRAYWGVVLLVVEAKFHFEGDWEHLHLVTDIQEIAEEEAAEVKEKVIEEKSAAKEKVKAEEEAELAEAEEKAKVATQTASEAEAEAKAAEVAVKKAEKRAPRAPEVAISPVPTEENVTGMATYPGRKGDDNLTVVAYGNGTVDARYTTPDGYGDSGVHLEPEDTDPAAAAAHEKELEDEEVLKQAEAERAEVAAEKAEQDLKVARLEASFRNDKEHPDGDGIHHMVAPEDEPGSQFHPPLREGEEPPEPERFAPELPSRTSTTTLGPGEPKPAAPPGWVDLAARPELKGLSAVEVNPEPIEAAARHGYALPEPRGADLICSAGDDITFQQCQGLPIVDCLPPCYTLSRSRLPTDDPGVRVAEDHTPYGATNSELFSTAEKEALLTVLDGLGLGKAYKDDPPCTWPGVQCDASDGYFIDLEPGTKEEANTHGELKPGQHWFDLKHLQILRIVGTNVTGSIPQEIGGPRALKAIDLSGNRFSGHIPTALGYLPELKVLLLAFNSLTGPIPPVLGHLPKLKALNLAANYLTGRVPGELGQAPLEYLHLFQNKLRGPLPHQLGDLEYLRELSVHDNGMNGTLPREIGQLRSLEKLALSYNTFTGPLPAEIGCLPQLQTLWVQGNALTGRIPPTLGLLDNAEELLLSRNMFTGTVPITLSRLARCETLTLSRNRLSGDAPDWLGCMPSLTTVGLAGQQPNAPGGAMRGVEELLEEMAPGWKPPTDTAAANRAGYWRLTPQWSLESHLVENGAAGAIHEEKAPDFHKLDEGRLVVDKQATEKELSQQERDSGLRMMRVQHPDYPPSWFHVQVPMPAPQRLVGLMPHYEPVPMGGSLAELERADPAPDAAAPPADAPVVTASRRRCNPPKMFSKTGESSGSWTDAWAPGSTKRAELRKELQCDRQPEKFIPDNPLR